MKILICGNGPTLPDQLKGKDLSEFDEVVRINDWKEIEGADNRCDVWVFFPGDLCNGDKVHSYDPKWYVENIKKMWLVNPLYISESAYILGKIPDKIMSHETRKLGFYILNGDRNPCDCAPSTGFFTILLAMTMSDDVTIAGFGGDGEYNYFDRDGWPGDIGEGWPHNPGREKIWIDEQISTGTIKRL